MTLLKELVNRPGWHYLALQHAQLHWECRQCIDEGRDVSSVQAEFERLLGQDPFDPSVQAAMGAMLDRTILLPMLKDYRYVEPSDLSAIRAERGASPKLDAMKLSRAQLRERLYGAWLGRCCGCLLGKPVECNVRARIHGYLQASGQWPLSAYLRGHDAAEQSHPIMSPSFLVDRLSGFMPIDDDTNYTVIGLSVIKQYGVTFAPVDVATTWMVNLPMAYTCTAERVAYRNFSALILPPDSASYRNVYREWIGAQIRADFFGYVCPGNIELAAELAWRDASISHVKNGIYGEMWVAAMLAAAFVSDDIVEVIDAGLSQIPAKSRLHEAVCQVMAWHGQGVSVDQAHDRIHRLWDETQSYGWVHTISNAMIVTAALLWGGGDYGRTICLAVQAAMDTDCNGATVGSIVGAMLGTRGIDRRWSEPINDTLATSISGYGQVKISALADETLGLIETLKTP
jgi:ADP-ribosylglycohydrolase